MRSRAGKFRTKFAAVVWLTAQVWLLFVSAVPAIPVAGDLVYCPLQRAWVSREVTPQPRVDLTQICSPSELKNKFVSAVRNSLKTTVSESTFFGYAVGGDGAFREAPDKPELPLGKLSVQERATVAVRTSFANDLVTSAERYEFRVTEAASIVAATKVLGDEPILATHLYLANTSPRGPPVISL